jgi:hypothetical protein
MNDAEREICRSEHYLIVMIAGSALNKRRIVKM